MGKEVKLTFAKLRTVFAVIYFVSIIPLVIAGFFNYPSADDFSMGIYVHDALISSGGNPFAALGEAFYRSWYYYFNWMGYYFASFVMVLPPSVANESMYVLATPILLAVYTAGVLFFMRQLLTRLFAVGKEAADIAGFMVLILSVQCMPEGKPRVESFFWYCGSANYTMLYATGLVWLGLLIRFAMMRDKTWRRVLRYVLACLLGFLMGGANYMTALSLAVVSFLLIVWELLPSSIRIRLRGDGASSRCLPLILPCALEIAGLVCSGLAPGNNVRLDLIEEPMSPVKAVFMGLYYTFSYCFSEWTTWAVLALLLLFSPILMKIAKTAGGTFEHPVIICALAYGLVSCNIVPPLYAMRNIEAGRMQAVIFEQYLLVLVLTLMYIFAFFAGKRAAAKSIPEHVSGTVRAGEVHVVRKEERSAGFTVSRGALGFYAAGLAFALFGAALSVYVNPHVFSATGALRDVVSGDAALYRRECAEREAVMKDESVRDAVLKPFTVEPLTLFYDDIRTDPEDWENTSYAKYYGKDSVRRGEH